MYYLMRTIAFFFSLMSQKQVEHFSRGLTYVLFDLFKVRRKVILRNLNIAFGSTMSEKQQEEVGRLSVYHFIVSIMEFLRSKRFKIDADVTLIGDHFIREALNKKQGVYILCFHMGNWEVMGAACTHNIAPSHVLVKKVGSGSMNRFISELRDHNGFLMVKREKKGDGIAAIQEYLKRNEVIGFVMDQSRPGEPRLPFFGHPARTNTSFAAIWRRHPAPIVPAFIYRTEIGKHRLEFFPEVSLEVTDDAPGDILKHSALFNSIIESHVRKHPEQYFWMHNRWK